MTPVTFPFMPRIVAFLQNKRRIERPLPVRLHFESAHEPLADKQTWDIVQGIRTITRVARQNELCFAERIGMKQGKGSPAGGGGRADKAL